MNRTNKNIFVAIVNQVQGVSLGVDLLLHLHMVQPKPVLPILSRRMGNLWSVVMYFYNVDYADTITSPWWSSSNFKDKYSFNLFLFWLVLRKLSAILWGISKESPSNKVPASNPVLDLLFGRVVTQKLMN